MLDNIRFGARALAKSPGFTAIAVGVLALGIGANATIFSIINAILFRPIAVRDPGRLVGIYQHDVESPQGFNLFSYPDFTDLRSGKDAAFTEVFAFGMASVGVQDELTTKVLARVVSANYFSALGVAPALGRVFLPEEETGGTPVAVLSYAYWTQLGAERSIVGRKLKLTRGELTVIGVMPKGFTGAQLLSPDMFLPLGMAETLAAVPGQPAPRLLASRSNRSLMLMGRLKPGLTLANVDRALDGLNAQFSMPDPAEPKARKLICTAPSRFNFGNAPSRGDQGLLPIAGFAFGLATLVLFIACLNLANMMLARGAARRKEIAVRLALGAGRRRIMSQLLVEGSLLAVLGGAAALVVSIWATRLLTALVYSGNGMPSDFPRFEFATDWRVLGALFFLSGVATLAFALGPAWKMSRLDVVSDLKRHAGEDAQERGRGRFRGRELLAIGQVAAALALMVAAALFSRSAVHVAEATPGFEFGSNFYCALDPSLSGYSDARVRELVRGALERLGSLPGVESVSPAMNIPFGDSNWSRGVQRGGAPAPTSSAASAAEGKDFEATYNVVGADYFRTMGMTLRLGREFERREAEGSSGPLVAIISQRLADELWPGENPLGRTIQFSGGSGTGRPPQMTVVGVVPPVRWQVFARGPFDEIYVPSGQDFQANVKLHVRVAPGVDPLSLMASARAELHRLDPQIPLTEVKTLAALHRDGPFVRIARLGSALFGAFGALAVILSVLGLYGLKAYSVARRTREIGIRMALGATARDVVTMVVREGAWLAGWGIALGLLLALAVGRFAESFLYQVSAFDPPTFGVIPPLLLVMTLLACFIPAQRAAKVAPMVALRHE